MQTQDSVSFVGLVQFRGSRCVWLSATPWAEARQASLSITNCAGLAQTHRVGDAIQPSHPLSSLSPPALNISLVGT